MLAAVVWLWSSPAAAQSWMPQDLGLLGLLAGTPNSRGNAINDNGGVVGTYTGAGGLTRAFLHPGNGWTDLGTGMFPNAVNNANQITGYASPHRAFLWTAATGLQDIGTLGGTISVGNDINNAGQIVGHSQVMGNATIHAFLWTPGVGMIDLGTLGGPSVMPSG